MVEQVGDPGVVADLVQGPRAAVGALRAHRDAETGNISGWLIEVSFYTFHETF